MAHSQYDTGSPIALNLFKYIFNKIRDFKARFKERFEIDHCMSGNDDTTTAGADGQHNQVTFNPLSTDPDFISGTNMLYSKLVNNIPELFCRKSDGVYQLTENGKNKEPEEYSFLYDYNTYMYGICSVFNKIYWCYPSNSQIILKYFNEGNESVSSEIVIDNSQGFLQQIVFINSMLIVAGSWLDGTNYKVFIAKSTDGETWTKYKLDIIGQPRIISYKNNKYIIPTANDGVLVSDDLTTFTHYSFSLPENCHSYGNVEFFNGYYYRTYSINSTHVLQKSVDLINWTTVNSDFKAQYIYSMNNRLFGTYSTNDPYGCIKYSDELDDTKWSVYTHNEKGYINHFMRHIIIDDIFYFNLSSPTYRYCKTKNFTTVEKIASSTERLMSGCRHNNIIYLAGDLLAKLTIKKVS